jgi:flavodoxin
MKTLVVYSSLTGNTKQVGEAVAAELSADLKPVEDSPAADGYDLVAVGTWIDKGSADAKAVGYIKGLKNQKVAFFVTLGADPKSEHAAKCLDKIAALLDKSNEHVGSFICQGKIDPKLIERMNQMFAGKEHAGNPHAPGAERDARHKKASTHPDEQDLADARAFFAGIKEKLTKR